MGMSREEAIKIIKECKEKGFKYTFYTLNEYYTALDMAIKALEQEPCEDREYGKDLNELKEQILKEGNTLVSKRDLLERFVEIDNEYKNRPWNLLQILTNINILIGEELCEDCISRQAAIDAIAETIVRGESLGSAMAEDILYDVPPAQPEIIRCKDCKHYQFADNRAFGMPVKMCEWFGFEDVDEDDFCSRAERGTV